MSSSIERGRFPVPVDRDVVAASWRQRGYSCGLFIDPPGQQWNDFVHGTNELVTVVEGKLALEIGDERFVAMPGDEVFIPRGATHSVHNLHTSVSRWLYGYD